MCGVCLQQSGAAHWKCLALSPLELRSSTLPTEMTPQTRSTLQAVVRMRCFSLQQSTRVMSSTAAASVSRGTQRPVIYLGRECAASVTSYPPLCTDVHPATSLPHCYRDRTPRALRDLRAPSGGQVCLLGFLRHASELERQPNLSAGMLYRESR